MSDALLALVAALAGGFVAIWTSERQLRLANVTAERAAWRERVRALAADLLAGPQWEADCGERPHARMRAAVVLQLSTNPFDPLDREIVEIALRIARSDQPDEADHRLLALRLQLLLKHDWERAKVEAGWAGPLRRAMRRLAGRRDRPARPDYARFVEWRSRNGIDMDARLPPP